MDEPTPKSIWQPSATFIVLILCALWIAATAWARWSMGRADASIVPRLGAGSAIGIAIALVAATLIVSRFLSIDLHFRVRTGEVITAILFAAIASAHIADDAVTFRDGVTAWLALVGVHFACRPAARWIGVTLVGVACGCSPLVAGALLVVAATFARPATQFIGFAITLFLGVFFYPMFTPREVPWTYAFPVPQEVARVGPAYLWTLAADLGDVFMPVLVLALLAVAEGLFGRPEDTVAPPEPPVPSQALRLWLLLNAVAAITMPRVLVSHGLLFILPAFLMAPAGWRLLRDLPLTRSNWTVSLLSACSYALLVWLAWTPVRISAELIMAALWVR